MREKKLKAVGNLTSKQSLIGALVMSRFWLKTPWATANAERLHEWLLRHAVLLEMMARYRR